MKAQSASPTEGIVQGLWVGEQLGPLQQLCIRSFLRHGHVFHLYTYGDVAGVPSGTTVCDAAAIVPAREIFRNAIGFGAGSYGAFSDIFRYQLLFERGGWWVDTDVYCLRPFRFDGEHVFAAEVSRYGQPTTTTCVIRSPARSDYLAYCLDVCTSTRRDTLEWGQIGPELLDDAITRFDLTPYRVSTETFNPINYFDVGELILPAFQTDRLRNSYGVHLWNQMWHSLSLDPLAPVPADSLMARLLTCVREDA